MREAIWVGSSLFDVQSFPDDVQDEVGYALYVAQIGGKHRAAKPLKGFSGANVLEIVVDEDGDTYRAVYTVQFADAVYVLHAFQKKSTKGAATPQRHLELIGQRLKEAINISIERQRVAHPEGGRS
jgi:phage-related protein